MTGDAPVIGVDVGGTQMRAGVIDVNEARARRAVIEKESQMFGSMDGAMKFVKGDAIAGLIITGINVIGGVVIGILVLLPTRRRLVRQVYDG